MKTGGIGFDENRWIIREDKFSSRYLGKSEVNMALGNGYMGIRSATEERYLNEVRNTFIAGTFNKANSSEVTELPNIPDFIEMKILINGQLFSLIRGEIIEYTKQLNLKNAELIRKITWKTEETGEIDFEFKRFVSQKDLNLVVSKVTIAPKDKNLKIEVISGINGQVTNSGAQHFIEGDKRFYNKKIMNMRQVTSESDIEVSINTMHRVMINSVKVDDNVLIGMDRRKIYGSFNHNVDSGDIFEMDKLTIVETSRDRKYENCDKNVFEKAIFDQIEKLNEYETISYESLLKVSEKELYDRLWSKAIINIDSEVGFDSVAVRFAQYHLHIMMPAHDNRMGIGAKGLTGEGYKGHSFWDTEVFIFPYFLYTQPKVARQLLEYRYLTLSGARRKAMNNNYQGAQFPWESAWLEDGEVTPVCGAADIITGKSTKIWSGFIEEHITADIAFAIYQYFSVTDDKEFMNLYGYEMLFETAIFWSSRLEDGEDGKLHINNVIGPDEYKEHINDNAFTNYLVKLNLDIAIKYVHYLEDINIEIFNKLNQKLDLHKQVKIWEDKTEKLYLPIENNDLIIPQDDSYLKKEIIDLTKYKNQKNVGSLFNDYNLSQVNNIQVSKQADIMMLFYLREAEFSKEVKKANWDYYEPKTLHDSSLSLSTHAIIANDLGDYPLAYDLYTRCREIDLGPNMKSSDHGIHAASLGGMIQVILNGFGGIRVLNGDLRIEPKLPETWNRLQFNLNWHKDILEVEITKEQLVVINKTKNSPIIEFIAFGSKYLLVEKTTISLKNDIRK